jgi:hypothetical protein
LWIFSSKEQISWNGTCEATVPAPLSVAMFAYRGFLRPPGPNSRGRLPESSGQVQARILRLFEVFFWKQFLLFYNCFTQKTIAVRKLYFCLNSSVSAFPHWRVNNHFAHELCDVIMRSAHRTCSYKMKSLKFRSHVFLGNSTLLWETRFASVAQDKPTVFFRQIQLY